MFLLWKTFFIFFCLSVNSYAILERMDYNKERKLVIQMKVLQVKQLQEMDEHAKQMHIPGILLMEHAAIALKKHIDTYIYVQTKKCIKILCGSGNNGGDGFALARLLHCEEMYDVEILCAHSIDHLAKDAQVYAKICEALEIPWYKQQDAREMVKRLQEADILVDCLFGTGLNRAIDGWNEILIDMINMQSAYVLSADIASGLHGDSGEVLGVAVKADATVAFVAGVLGQYTTKGNRHSGHIEIADISMPTHLYEATNYIDILDDSLFQTMWKQRDIYAHKGSFGKGLVIGGSMGMSGAASMVAQASLRCGIGTITTMCFEESIPLLAPTCMEMMCKKLPMKHGELDVQAFKNCIHAYDVIAFGNGMGRSSITKQIVKLLWESEHPCIFDGDALFYLQDYKGKTRDAQTILTPHPKEVSYLLGITTGEIEKNLSETLKTMKKAYPTCVIAMKNANTLVFDQKMTYLNIHGNDGLATGGSGDILCGMILGLLAQGNEALQATCMAVYLHACSAEDLHKHMPTASILPRDLLKQIPKTLQAKLK